MGKYKIAAIASAFILSGLLCHPLPAQSSKHDQLTGTLVVAVPVNDGLVVCSDKRIYNQATSTFRDDFIKVRKANQNALFVATHTVGFLNADTNRVAFDVFEIASQFVSKNPFVDTPAFWNGLKQTIRTQLLQYLATQKFQDWPETDVANDRLLFNLVFYSVSGSGIHSYSLRVFYEKARTPVVYIPNRISEAVKTPKLSGKGNLLMAYLARNPSLAHDPVISRFDQSNFDSRRTTVTDAVTFASKLFRLANIGVPQAQVSASYDCALLSYQTGFQMLTVTERPIK